MKKFYISICLIFTLTLSSCGLIKPTNKAFDMRIKPDISEENGRLKIEFITNLPDGTEGYIKILNEELDFLEQTFSQVKHGRIKSPDLFSYNGDPFPKGEYEIIFTLPHSSLQPARITEILGENYKYIRSPYLIDNQSGQTLEYRSNWIIE